jgi:dihydropyrimidinase
MSAIDYNVFEGVKVEGLPRTTISRGEVVYEGGQMSAKPGRGKFVARQPFPAAARALSEWKKHIAVKKIAR